MIVIYNRYNIISSNQNYFENCQMKNNFNAFQI